MKRPLNIIKYKLCDYLDGYCLDAGAGDGRHLQFMQRADALESGPIRLGNCETFIMADLDLPLPIKSYTYDTVLCSHVLEHLERPGNALDEFHRILKINGTLVIGVPNKNCIHTNFYDGSYDHKTIWDDVGLRCTLDAHGFVTTDGPFTNYPLGGALLFLLFNKTPLRWVWDDIWLISRRVSRHNETTIN